jgi:CBS domain containing-hemolysin-like protein
MNGLSLAMSGLPAESARMDPGLGLAIGLILVVINGFFVAAEFALVKLRPTQIEPLLARGDPRAKVAAHMLHHLDAYLSASQLGITLASLALGWVGEPAFAWVVEPLVMKIPGATPSMVHSVSVAVAFVTITCLHIVLGEQAPKSFAIRKSQATVLWVSLPLFVFFKVTYPIIWVLNKASISLIRLVGIEPVSEEQLVHSEEELRLLLGSEDASRLSDQKREIIDNVFELSHRTARQLMVPRSEVVYLSLSRTVEENLEIARKSGHTRFPLCKEHLDDIVGLVHIKDLFRAKAPTRSLDEIKRPIQFVPETLTVDRLLRRMQKERLHLCAVVDEYGGVNGIVTLENVIEELVGEIRDEFDAEEKPELVKKGDNVYRVSGGMLVMDLEDELDIEFSERDEDTVAGVVMSELGRLPRVGDQVTVGPLTLEVLEVSRHTIKTLQVTVVPPETQPAAES